MTTTRATDEYTRLPDDQTLATTILAMEERGFSVEVADDLDEARDAVLTRIPAGATVMTNTSITLDASGIADAINDEDGPYESARNKLLSMNRPSLRQQAKAVTGQPDFSLGSVHAVTHDGSLVIASKSGSQLASYAWGAANVVLVVGAHKLVATIEDARERVYRHSLPLEDARAFAAYGQNSSVGKILEIHEETPGRIHVVLVRQPIGF
jgi:LUD domain